MSHPPPNYNHPSAPPVPSSWQQQQSYARPPLAPYDPYSQSTSWTQYAPPPPAAAPHDLPPYACCPPAASYDAPPLSFSQPPFPPGTDPEIVRAFQLADRDRSGLVDEVELQKVLSAGQPFSLRTVRLMMHMYGPKDSRKIGPREFAALWKALKEWKVIFDRFDKDRSGSINKGEMREALLSLGYSISFPILDCLLQKYDRTGQGRAMDYDSFVE